MKVITFLNEKGGVGKTTLATTMASALASKEYRVLLIDSDAQGHVAVAFGLPETAGLYDLMVRKAAWQDVVREIPAEQYAKNGQSTGRLVVVPSNDETRNIANSMSDGFLLANRLRDIETIFDFVIIDTSPTPSLLHSAILAATDYVIHPTTLESFSFNGLKKSIEHLQGLSDFFTYKGHRDPLQTIGIVPTIAELNTLEHVENFKALKQQFRHLVWRPIAKSTIWRECNTAKMSIFAYAPESRAAEAAWKLYAQLAKVLGHVS